VKKKTQTQKKTGRPGPRRHLYAKKKTAQKPPPPFKESGEKQGLYLLPYFLLKEGKKKKKEEIRKGKKRSGFSLSSHRGEKGDIGSNGGTKGLYISTLRRKGK